MRGQALNRQLKARLAKWRSRKRPKQGQHRALSLEALGDRVMLCSNLTINPVPPLKEMDDVVVSGTSDGCQSIEVIAAGPDGSGGFHHGQVAPDGSWSVSWTVIDDDPSQTPVDELNIVVNASGMGLDGMGDSISASIKTEVRNVSPTITLNPIVNNIINEGESITLSGTIADVSPKDTHTLEVDWGDGSALQTFELTEQQFELEYRYSDDTPPITSKDNMTITATVVDDDKGRTSATASVTVNNVPPDFTSFSHSSLVIDEDNIFSVRGTFDDPGLEQKFVLTVDWGNGVVETTQLKERAFSVSKRYVDDDPSGSKFDLHNVSVQIADDDSGVDVQGATLRVHNVNPTLSVALPSFARVGEPVTLTGTFQDPGIHLPNSSLPGGATAETHVVAIEWGDGTVQWIKAAEIKYDLERKTGSFSLSHTYADIAPRAILANDVRVTLTDDDSGADTKTVPLPILGSVDLDVDSDNDGLIESTEDLTELVAPGHLLLINSDDDNSDHTLDFSQSGFFDNDLSRAINNTSSNGLLPIGWSVDLVAISGDSHLRVWSSSDKDVLFPFGISWDLSQDFSPGTFYLEGVSEGMALIAIQIRYLNETLSEDRVLVKIGKRLDLDIDSDNDNEFRQPDHSLDEEQNENREPGKIVGINSADKDDDLVPDYADGYNLESTVAEDDLSAGDTFTPLVVEVPDWTPYSSKLSFEYTISEPRQVTGQQHHYQRPIGGLRVWTKRESDQRDSRSVEQGGDLVKKNSHYGLHELGIQPGEKKTLWIEGLKHRSDQISVNLDLGLALGSHLEHGDQVRVGVVGVDIDIDSDNDGRPFADVDDRIENHADAKGHLLVRNVNDFDGDEYPGFADGFDHDSSSDRDDKVGQHDAPKSPFTPIRIRVDHLDDDAGDAVVRLKYDASDPKQVERDNVTRAWVPAEGALRVWNRDFDDDRNAAAVVQGGNFVPTNKFLSLKTLAGDDDFDHNLVTLYVEGIDASNAWGDQVITVEYFPLGQENENVVVSDQVKLTVIEIDLDIDSDNDRRFQDPLDPPYQDQIENSDFRAGKFVPINNYDLDHDRKVDFADNDVEVAQVVDRDMPFYGFTPIVAHLPEPFDLDKIKLRLSYAASEPSATPQFDEFVHQPDDGKLRLWTKDINEERSAARIDAPVAGHFVAPGTYSFAELQGDKSKRQILLYLEGVREGIESIHLELDPDGEPVLDVLGEGNASFIASDKIRLRALQIDLDVDSSNDHGSFPQWERTDHQDAIEAFTDEFAGKLIPVNRRDLDRDGIRDDLDGFNANGIPDADDAIDGLGEAFVPISVTLPNVVQPSDVRLRFHFDGLSPQQDAAGNLRIWRKGSSEARIYRDVRTGGDLVVPAALDPNAIYTWQQLGGAARTRHVVLWVEAIRLPTEYGSSQAIRIEVDPDGPSRGTRIDEKTGPAEFELMDELMIRVVDTVELSAVDKFGSEAKDPSLSDGVRFVVSRGTDNTTGDLEVLLETLTDQQAFAIAGLDDFTFSPDWMLTGSVVIPHGQYQVAFDYQPYDDSHVEWDEHIAVAIQSSPEDYLLLGSISPNGSSLATAVIYDNDGFGRLQSRDIDVAYGRSIEVVNNGSVAVDIYSGDTELTLPISPLTHVPTYRDNNNLQPIVHVETTLPDVPNTLTGALRFGSIDSSPQEYAIGNLITSSLEPLTSDDMIRIGLISDESVQNTLATGHYDYQVTLSADIGGEHRTRTVRGGTEVINQTHSIVGDDSFGQNWWPETVDVLVLNDGVSPSLSADANSIQELDSNPEATRGGRAQPGAALIRGDGSSAWFAEVSNSDTLISSESVASESEGSWQLTEGGHSGRHLVARSGSGKQLPLINWDFSSLAAGQVYQLFATWVPDHDRSDRVGYRVNGAHEQFTGTADKLTIVDQRFIPGEWEHDGTKWRSLGYYIPAGDRISVSLDLASANLGSSRGVVSADDLMLVGDWEFASPAGSIDHLEHGFLEGNDAEQLYKQYRDDVGTGSWHLYEKELTKTTFLGTGRPEVQLDANGNLRQFEFGDIHSGGWPPKLARITDQGGLETSFQYAGAGYSVTGSRSGRTEFIFDTNHQVVEVKHHGPLKVQTTAKLEYEGAERQLSAVIDSAGNRTELQYDSVTATVNSSRNADGGTWQFQPFVVDGVEHRLILQPIESDAVSFDFHTQLQVPRYRTPRAHVWTPNGLTAEPTYFTELQFDVFGQLTGKSLPNDNERIVWLWNRDLIARITRVIQPSGVRGIDQIYEGLTTDYVYDSAGNVLSSETSDGTRKRWSYHPTFHQIASFVDPLNNRTVTDYDERGNPIMVTEAAGTTVSRKTHTSYTDPPISMTDLPGGMVEFQTLGFATTTPRVSRTEYHKVMPRVGLVRVTTLAYSSQLASTVEYAYSENRDLIEVKQGDISTNYEFDDWGRVTTTTGQDPGTGQHGRPTSQVIYDAVGNVSAVIDPRGNATTFVYDKMNRRIEQNDPLPGGDLASPQHAGKKSWKYDVNGNLVAEGIRHRVVGSNAYSERTTHYEYDQLNRLVKIKRPTPSYPGIADELVPQAAISAPQVQYTYDVLGNVKSATDPRYPEAAPTIQFFYDQAGRLTQRQSRAGDESSHADVIEQFEYDASGQVVRKSTPRPGTIAGELTAIELVYDQLGRLTERHSPDVDDAAQLVQRTVYDAFDQPLKSETLTLKNGSEEPTGRVIDRAFDVLGQPIRIADGLVSTLFAYDEQGNQTSSLSFPGEQEDSDLPESLTDESVDQVYQQLESSSVSARLVRTEYDGLNRAVLRRHPDPDGDGPNEAVVDHFTYDLAGNLVIVEQSMKRLGGPSQSVASRHEYDALNRSWRTVTTYSDDNISNETRTLYNLDGTVRGQKLQLPDGEWRESRHSYDTLGRPYQYQPDLSLPEYRSTQFMDAAGNVIRTVDSRQAVVDKSYDLLGRLESVRRPLAIYYDNNQEITDGFTETFFMYYTNGQLYVTQFDATEDDNKRVYTYNELGHALSETQFVGSNPRTTRYEHDSFGNVTFVTDSLGNRTSFEYDDSGNRILESISIGGEKLQRRYEYDAFGNLTRSIDRNDRQIDYSYNQTGSRTKEVWLAPETNGLREEVYSATWEYSAAGHVLTDENHTVDGEHRKTISTQTYVRDSRGAPTQTQQVVQGVTTTTTAEYDSLGSRTQRAISTAFDSLTTNYKYDSLQRLIQMSEEGSISPRSLSWEFDVRTGDLNSVKRFESADPTTGYHSQTTSLLSSDGRLNQTKHENATGGIINLETLTYDKKGRLRTVGTLQGVERFRYDAADQLVETKNASTGEVKKSYLYDSLGNPTGIVDAHNRLRETKSHRMSYDREGNTTEYRRYEDIANKTISSNSQDPPKLLDWDAIPFGEYRLTIANLDVVSTHYPKLQLSFLLDGEEKFVRSFDSEHGETTLAEWNAFDATIAETGNWTIAFHWVSDSGVKSKATVRSVTIGVQSMVTHRLFDWDHRNRMTRMIHRNVTSGEVESTAEYAYDSFGQLVSRHVNGELQQVFLNEGGQEIAQFGSDGELLRYNSFSNSVDDVVATEVFQSDGSHQMIWLLKDRNGSVTELLSGVIHEHQSYDAFGQLESPASELARVARFGFAGRPREADSQLYFKRARVYDAELGRWLSEDPSGFLGGDANLYRFAHNSPTHFRDPTGELAITIPSIAIGLGLVARQQLLASAGNYDTARQLSAQAVVSPEDAARIEQLISKASAQQFRGTLLGTTSLVVAGSPGLTALGTLGGYQGYFAAQLGLAGIETAAESLLADDKQWSQLGGTGGAFARNALFDIATGGINSKWRLGGRIAYQMLGSRTAYRLATQLPGIIARQTLDNGLKTIYDTQLLGLPVRSSMQSNIASGVVGEVGMIGLAALGGRFARQITFYGFRSTAIRELHAIDPIYRYGHVGLSFNNGRRIFGFMPQVTAGLTPAQLHRLLLAKPTFGGMLGDQTMLFRLAAREQINIQTFRYNVNLWKYLYARTRVAIDALISPLHGKRYSLPRANGTFPAGCYNCATISTSYGLPTPIPSGLMKDRFLPG